MCIVRASPSDFALAALSKSSQATFSKVIEETREVGFDKCRKQMQELGASIRKGRVGIVSFGGRGDLCITICARPC